MGAIPYLTNTDILGVGHQVEPLKASTCDLD